ncbi:DeoR family transcriptional regulator [Variovorax rhizosphaerae]|uniref:DeoR family transcriptional regulator n=1 Tax=Variovorax rhizosphaerae TaxID=1836200 RepID=A0ABU8WUC1_9BURK
MRTAEQMPSGQRFDRRAHRVNVKILTSMPTRSHTPSSPREARVQQLDEALAARGVLHLRDAAALLDVSEMTVRRLVASHADAFTYLGGHIVRSASVGSGADYVLTQEEGSHAAAKAAACEHALKLIDADDTVFIDCGTTLEHLARMIPDDLPVSVVCYSLSIANLLATKPACRLFVLGGLFHPVSASFGGPGTAQALTSFGISKAFISAGGVDMRRGVSCSSMHEVPVKQQAMHIASASYLVVDESKFDRLRPALFAQVADFDALISEAGLKPTH